MLDEYGGEVYSDFVRFYPSFDLAGLIRGEVHPRLFVELVVDLPEDSCLRAAVQGGSDHRVWTTQTHLLASIIEVLQAANYQRGGGKGQKPKAIVRPKVKKKQGAAKSRFDEIAARARSSANG